MSLNGVLNWISQNPNQAFWLGVFLLIMAGIVGTAINTALSNMHERAIKLAQAKSGNFPPPRPVVECNGDCDCNKPCKCCEENGCQVGCGCSSEVDGDV